MNDTEESFDVELYQMMRAIDNFRVMWRFREQARAEAAQLLEEFDNTFSGLPPADVTEPDWFAHLEHG